jgi:hypothetical protein
MQGGALRLLPEETARSHPCQMSGPVKTWAEVPCRGTQSEKSLLRGARPSPSDEPRAVHAAGRRKPCPLVLWTQVRTARHPYGWGAR